ATVFEALLAEEPGHPEAMLGLRLATRGSSVVRPSKGNGKAEAAPDAGPAPAGEGDDGASVEGERDGSVGANAILVAGARVPVDVVVNSERWRFEERRRLREVARARHLDPDSRPVPNWYRERTDAAGKTVDVTRPEAV